MRKAASVFLRISITFVLLIFLFSKTDVAKLLEYVQEAHKGQLAAAFGLFFFLNILVLLRWQILLRARSLRVGTFRLFRAYLSGLFFNLVLPSTIGGDTVRTLDIAQHTGEKSSTILGTVVMDRVIGFFGLFGVLIISLLFGFRHFRDPSILIVAVILLGLVVFMFGALFSRRVFRFFFGWLPFVKLREYLKKVHLVTCEYWEQKGVLLTAFTLSVSIHLGLSFVFLLTAGALGERVPVVYALLFVPMVTAFSSLPISIGGLGLRDAATVFVFTKVGMAREPAFAISLLSFGFMFAVGLLGGVSYVSTLYRRRV